MLVSAPESCEQLCPQPRLSAGLTMVHWSHRKCVPRAHSACGAADSPQQLLKWKCLVPPPTSPRAWARAAAGRPKPPTQDSEPRGGDSIVSSKGDLAGMVRLGPAQQQGVVAAVGSHGPVRVIGLHGGSVYVPSRLAHGHRLAKGAAEAGLPPGAHGHILGRLQDLQTPACGAG